MRDLISSLVLMIYIGIVLIHKLLGYSYLNAAWRSLVFLVALYVLATVLVYGYRWMSEPEDVHANVNEPQVDNNPNK